MKKSIYQIMDANINRAMEGLRVSEEITRFILKDKNLTSKIKGLRHKLKTIINKIDKNNLLGGRDINTDTGKALYAAGEAKRPTLLSIFSANIKRCQESLRVLEEFSKFINPKIGRQFKVLRFELYTLEKKIEQKIKIFEKLDFSLYPIIDKEALGNRSLTKTAKEILAGGAKIIQYRDKISPKSIYCKNAEMLQKIAQKYKALFIVNDYVDICKKINADGVNIGPDDERIKTARKVLGKDKIIGASAYTLKEAKEAEKAGADYIGFGPVFDTKIKPGFPGRGLALLKKAAGAVKIPVVAIGGINIKNIGQVKKITNKTAIIRGLVQAGNVIARTKQLLRRLGSSRLP